MEEIIRLRGHHLAMLADFCWVGNLSKDVSKFPAKDVDLNIDFQYRLILRLSEYFDDYGENHKKRVKLIYRILTENPNVQVQIVKGLDSICLPDCPLKRKDCSLIGKEDSFCLKEYKLKPNRTYYAKELMDRIKRYPGLQKKELKWVNSPRWKFGLK